MAFNQEITFLALSIIKKLGDKEKWYYDKLGVYPEFTLQFIQEINKIMRGNEFWDNANQLLREQIFEKVRILLREQKYAECKYSIPKVRTEDGMKVELTPQLHMFMNSFIEPCRRYDLGIYLGEDGKLHITGNSSKRLHICDFVIDKDFDKEYT
ncbi:MAG: hypothetical protein J6A59_10555 [Lachnospiraceae bacterium]|nr:hypothetical protein [Lachnospiraceae bacterium]